MFHCIQAVRITNCHIKMVDNTDNQRIKPLRTLVRVTLQSVDSAA